MYMYHKCISCIHMYFPTYELYIHMLSASQPWWHDQQHGIKISCKASVGWPGASMKARVKFRVRYGSLDVKKTMGSLHRTVKWNQMGYRTTSSLCRPWNCFFFFWFFFVFPEHFFISRIWTRWPATLQLEGRNHRYKTAWDGWDSSPWINDFCLHIWSG